MGVKEEMNGLGGSRMHVLQGRKRAGRSFQGNKRWCIRYLLFSDARRSFALLALLFSFVSFTVAAYFASGPVSLDELHTARADMARKGRV